MAFQRLQALGEERFGKIINLLMRGESAMGLARQIQQPPPEGWGEFQDVAEKTLTQMLNRLRLRAAEGAYGAKTAKWIAQGNKPPQINRLERISVRVLDRMEELSDIQRDRVLALVEREKLHLLPTSQAGNLHIKMAPQEYRHLLTQTNLVFNDYRELLKDIQKIRFDLGLDEFKGPVGASASQALRGASTTVNLPDGTNIQKQVFEVVRTVEQIFDQREIPVPVIDR